MGTHPIFESDFDCLTEMGRCLQVLFVFVNFLVFVLGAALTALSIWLLVDPDSLFDLINQVSDNTSTDVPEIFNDIIDAVSAALYLSLATGIFLFLMGFLGCCGAAKKNKCMLNIFSGVTILLILAEIAAVIMAFVYYPQVDTFMQERVDAYTPDAAEPDDIFNKEFVDQLQKSFKCCGWKGADDFTETPDSCCADANETGTCSPYNVGCESEIQKGAAIIGGVAAGCVVLE